MLSFAETQTQQGRPPVRHEILNEFGFAQKILEFDRRFAIASSLKRDIATDDGTTDVPSRILCDG